MNNNTESGNRDEIRSADLALISGRQMHRINARIFLVAITKNTPDNVGGVRLFLQYT